jgi:microcystin-dependent protein
VQTSSASGLTRRWLLKAGGAAAVSVVGVRGGWRAQPASAALKLPDDEIFPGELRLFAGDYVPAGWLLCVGQELAADQHEELAKAVGSTFGGDGSKRFGLPDLRGRGLLGAGHVAAEKPRKVSEYGHAIVAQHAGDRPSSLGMTYLIAPEFNFDEPLVGEVRAFSFRYAPEGWRVCDGRKLTIKDHVVLYSIIGNRFGGSHETFTLPDLRGATPVEHGHGPHLAPVPFGMRRLDLAVGTGGRQPRLHVNYCIAVAGRYPSRQ